MLATFRQNLIVKQRSLRCSVDSKLRDKERPITSRKQREAKNSSRSSRLIQIGKEKWLQIHVGRILNSFRYRESQINIGWNEELCARYDANAAEDHSYIATASERCSRENVWVLVLNSSGPKPDEPT